MQQWRPPPTGQVGDRHGHNRQHDGAPRQVLYIPIPSSGPQGQVQARPSSVLGDQGLGQRQGILCRSEVSCNCYAVCPEMLYSGYHVFRMAGKTESGIFTFGSNESYWMSYCDSTKSITGLKALILKVYFSFMNFKLAFISRSWHWDESWSHWSGTAKDSIWSDSNRKSVVL